MSFDSLKKVFDPATVEVVYRSSVRYALYCPPLAVEESALKSEAEADKKRRRCSKIANRDKRERCREEKIMRCRRRRRTRRRSPLEQPCTSRERRRRNRKLRKGGGPSRRNCSSLSRRRDRKLCRRKKRARCRNRMAVRHPLFSAARLAQMCRARNWLDRCSEGRARASGSSGSQAAREGCKRDLKRRLGKGTRTRTRTARSGKGDLQVMTPRDVEYL